VKARGFAALNVVLCCIWLLVVWQVRAMNQARSGALTDAGPTSDAAATVPSA
jgi:uncharacterized membrane protein